MSEGGQKQPSVFDIERIRAIVELMEQHSLGEVDLQQGDEKIKLTRGGIAPIGPLPVAAPMSVPVASPAATDHEAAGSDTAGTITINSPMVGTFYAKPNPESKPFISVGDSINEETVVCIIEAMKVFNEIPAECKGKIVDVLVDDQQAVDFGKPLFRVQPA